MTNIRYGYACFTEPGPEENSPVNLWLRWEWWGALSAPDSYILLFSYCTLQALPLGNSCWQYCSECSWSLSWFSFHGTLFAAGAQGSASLLLWWHLLLFLLLLLLILLLLLWTPPSPLSPSSTLEKKLDPKKNLEEMRSEMARKLAKSLFWHPAPPPPPPPPIEKEEGSWCQGGGVVRGLRGGVEGLRGLGGLMGLWWQRGPTRWMWLLYIYIVRWLGHRGIRLYMA